MTISKKRQILEATINAQVSQNYQDCQEWINETLRIMAKGTKHEKDVNWALEVCNNYKSLWTNQSTHIKGEMQNELH
ncbi:hypothetical protein PDQ69_24245 [Bacillus cereus group sp. Bc062]|uniref:Uncharacterized protein n=1 Tax=Bacillus paranthracis TaxID=2026186 RepID=A0AAX3QHB0_9BACI|nr:MULTISPECIES: hypothetical protein [Bacillus]MBE7145053.1 hypothetical protein [Bacillus paranthracis]MCU5211677.1 hypothetical protein [Bacillus paranthracis]MDA2146842.1 hypothetical protein [Bacillus cereus group sp. Bc248]MDA2174743.1 hypothetical protein [Bacillus cereus group sp. Bc247]MDA2588225.1 hypothetical protein [Bacillus cereus group sp. Bc062]